MAVPRSVRRLTSLEGSIEVVIDPGIDKLRDIHFRGLLRHEPHSVGFKLQTFAPGMDFADCVIAESPNR